jgi:hypothetical protein
MKFSLSAFLSSPRNALHDHPSERLYAPVHAGGGQRKILLPLTSYCLLTIPYHEQC